MPLVRSPHSLSTPSLTMQDGRRGRSRGLLLTFAVAQQTSYAHPIFWAPFSLVGDEGGSAKAGK